MKDSSKNGSEDLQYANHCSAKEGLCTSVWQVMRLILPATASVCFGFLSYWCSNDIGTIKSFQPVIFTIYSASEVFVLLGLICLFGSCVGIVTSGWVPSRLLKYANIGCFACLGMSSALLISLLVVSHFHSKPFLILKFVVLLCNIFLCASHIVNMLCPKFERFCSIIGCSCVICQFCAVVILLRAAYLKYDTEEVSAVVAMVLYLILLIVWLVLKCLKSNWSLVAAQSVVFVANASELRV